jgi:hypothetical protein
MYKSSLKALIVKDLLYFIFTVYVEPKSLQHESHTKFQILKREVIHIFSLTFFNVVVKIIIRSKI